MRFDLLSPHFSFSSILDGVDLSSVHWFACLFGAIFSVWVSQLWSTGSIKFENDCWFSRHARRIALTVLALSMLWSLAYSTNKGWEPWPPDLIGLLAVDFFLLSTIIISVKRQINASDWRSLFRSPQ